MNDTLRTVDGRAVLRMERRLAHPAEKIWHALTDPGHLSQWYPFHAVELDLRVGGKVSFDDGEGSILAGVVTELDPPWVFAFSQDAGAVLEREGENILHFELRPDAGGCLLVFTHTFHDRPHAAANAAGWDACLAALAAVLDGTPVEQPDRWAERHEAYVKAFGLDEGSSETTPDGWRVRFERQLMQATIENVWAALSAAGSDAATPDTAVVGGPVPAAFTTRTFTTGTVTAGPVTAVDGPTLLEYDWQLDGHPAGQVRWELSSSPAGARITVTQTGPTEPAAARPAALAAWQTYLERLVERL